MAPATVAQGIVLYVAGLGGTAAGNEQHLIKTVRQRLNAKYQNPDSFDVKLAVFIFGCEPIIEYLAASVASAQLTAMAREDLAGHVHRIFVLIAQRTRLQAKYGSVTEDDTAWLSVEAGLQLILRGQPASPPAYAGAPPTQVWRPPRATHVPWWSRRRWISFFLVIVAIVGHFLRNWFELGRSRVYLTLICVFILIMAFCYLNYGPDALPGFVLQAADRLGDALDDGAESDASEASEAQSEHTVVPKAAVPPCQQSEASESAAVQRLSAEMAELKQLMHKIAGRGATPDRAPGAGAGFEAPPPPEPADRTGPMQTLLDFANAVEPSGPISMTAARQMASSAPMPAAADAAPMTIQLEPALPPPAVPAVSQEPNAWSPYAAPVRAKSQATALLSRYNQWVTQRSTNPWWGQQLWQDIARMEVEAGVEPDVLAVLRNFGYHGAHSTGAPREGLKTALEKIRDTPSPAIGSGSFPGSPPGLTGMNFPTSDSRWQGRLPPDLQRAAPEIYRAMRAEAAANIREWLDRRFQGPKNNDNPSWVDLWNAASEIDFRLEQAIPGTEMMVLATDDGLEIKLRRLAAHAHLTRTGDLNSATHLLAIKPPGTNTDVAPSWLLTEATTFSKSEHQRAERVSKPPKGKGKGKKGGKGKGKGDKPASA